MASALDGPTLSSTRSMVAASAVLMFTLSAAKALPARASASSSECAISLIDFMTVSLSVGWIPAIRRRVGSRYGQSPRRRGPAVSDEA